MAIGLAAVLLLIGLVSTAGEPLPSINGKDDGNTIYFTVDYVDSEQGFYAGGTTWSKKYQTNEVYSGALSDVDKTAILHFRHLAQVNKNANAVFVDGNAGTTKYTTVTSVVYVADGSTQNLAVVLNRNSMTSTLIASGATNT